MRRHFILAGVVLICGFGIGAWADTLVFTDLPAAAQTTVRAQADGATFGAVDKDEDDGEIQYTVTVTKDGKDRDITVAEDGTLRSLEISLEDVPSPVRRAINKVVGSGTLGSVSRSFDDDNDVSYDVTMTNTAGVERSFTVETNGAVSSLEVSLEETPDAVRTTIESQIASLNAKLGEIDKMADEDGISYNVEAEAGGKKRDIDVLADGKLDSVQVFQSELPPVGQRTLENRLGDGKLKRIDKEFGDAGGFTFHVEARKDGKPFNFIMGPRGRFQKMEDGS